MLIKKLLKKLPFYPTLIIIYRKLKRIPRHPIQDSKTVDGFNITHLGTPYGGWSFVDEKNLHGCTIVSAGLGEDASFDIEFASKYNAKVIIVDPTPRAISHFEKIIEAMGNTSKRQYSEGGCQPIDAYNLSDVTEDNFTLITKALWNKNTNLKFFEPTNPNHVSHSIVNYQNNYAENTKSIEVEAVTLDSLLIDLFLDKSVISLMKLDIEGAEIEVIERCIEVGIMPRQILVEFDELNVPSSKGFARVTEVDDLLRNNGYKLLKTDGQTDFLYLR
ncbi:FkbM family methyltransferase [Amylibacter sp.]|nr:FkbM family methyltransferase [Amylibacter sp.]